MTATGIRQHAHVAPDDDDVDHPFPWLPTLAPLVTAGVLWVATGSALAMLFGIMSPVMLVAQFVETRRRSRRRAERRRERAELLASEERSALTAEQRAVIQDAQLEHPPADRLLELVDVARFIRPTEGAVERVRVGSDESGLPVHVDARDGIVVTGAPDVRRALVRALTAQLWWTTGDISREIEPTSDAHATARWHIRVTSASRASVSDWDAPARPARRIRPDELTSEQLARLRAAMASRVDATVRPHVSGAAIVSSDPTHHDPFDVVVGITRTGQDVSLNLIRRGPHAAISGTTGSGKTSFVVAWLTKLASQCAPSEFEFAIVDFKGGIDFADLRALPHCVGFASDLDEDAIDRALVGLQSEILRRERMVGAGRALEELPRLVVVFDEFRATAAAHPRAVPVVVDLVARGRALGMHLVLCTQRAASSLSDEILANVPVRIAFRALTNHESVFLVGDARAHDQLRDPGDAVIVSGGRGAELVHMHEHTVLPATERKITQSSRQLWAQSLPVFVTHDEAAAHPAPDSHAGLCMGVVDAQTHQRWESAWYSPEADGHLLLTGPARSGRSSAIRALAFAATRHDGLAQAGPIHPVVIDDEVVLWDWLDPRWRDGAELARSSESATLVLIDGIERLMGNLPPDGRDSLSEWLFGALRAVNSTRFVIGCDADGAWAMRLASLCGQRCDLRGARHPGRARWRDHWLQIPWVEPETGDHANTQDPASELTAVEHPFSNALGDVIEVVGQGMPGWPVSSIDDPSPVMLGSTHARVVARARASDWLDRLAEFTSLSREAHVLVRGTVSAADARLLFRGHTPLPPIRPGQAILLHRDGGYHRLRD